LTVAQKPDGKAARTERVTFTRPAAERIAKVVRAVEGGDRDTPGIYFGSAPGAAPGKTFRVCTFTGAWSIGSERTVTFKNVTTTPNTASAMNLLAEIPVQCDGSTTEVMIAKEGTAWYYVNHKLGCNGKPSARDLGDGAVCDFALDEIVDAADNPQLLLNDEGCPKWVGFTQKDVVLDVRIEDGELVVVKQKMFVVLHTEVEAVETIIALEECPAP
jgi:hypothetical protein